MEPSPEGEMAQGRPVEPQREGKFYFLPRDALNLTVNTLAGTDHSHSLQSTVDQCARCQT